MKNHDTLVLHELPKKMEMRKKLHISKFHTKKYGKERKINQPFFSLLTFWSHSRVNFSSPMAALHSFSSLYFSLPAPHQKSQLAPFLFQLRNGQPPLVNFLCFFPTKKPTPCSLISKAFYSRP